MRILFVNDDGYDSIGLHAVADLFKAEHEIAVVAPDSSRSAFSHAVTLKPVELKWRKIDGYDYDVFATSGTPVDCVKIGLKHFFAKPDLVISGINNGKNAGTDILYSGTVSAASDAASLGYKAIALSVFSHEASDAEFNALARFFKDNFERLTSIDMPPHTCLNINYPPCAPRGVKFAKMNTALTYVDAYTRTENSIALSGRRDYSGMDVDTDEALLLQGYVTITPITTDRTDYGALKKLKRIKFDI